MFWVQCPKIHCSSQTLAQTLDSNSDSESESGQRSFATAQLHTRMMNLEASEF